MASFALSRRALQSLGTSVRLNSTSAGAGGNGAEVGKGVGNVGRHKSAGVGTIGSKAGKRRTTKEEILSPAQRVDPKRFLQSFAQQPRRCDVISVAAAKNARDAGIAGVTLGQLKTAKVLGQVLHQRIGRWIYESDSWNLFAENKVEITRVKVMPDLSRMRIFWSSTGCRSVEDQIQLHLNRIFADEMLQRITSEKLFVGLDVPEMDFVVDSSFPFTSSQPGSISMEAIKKNELHKLRTDVGIETLKELTPSSTNQSVTVRHQMTKMDYQSFVKQLGRGFDSDAIAAIERSALEGRKIYTEK